MIDASHLRGLTEFAGMRVQAVPPATYRRRLTWRERLRSGRPWRAYEIVVEPICGPDEYVIAGRTIFIAR